jgi:hypothetical protein
MLMVAARAAPREGRFHCCISCTCDPFARRHWWANRNPPKHAIYEKLRRRLRPRYSWLARFGSNVPCRLRTLATDHGAVPDLGALGHPRLSRLAREGSDVCARRRDGPFVGALLGLLANPWEPLAFAGFHRCEFCRISGGPSQMQGLSLGTSNLYVPRFPRPHRALRRCTRLHAARGLPGSRPGVSTNAFDGLSESYPEGRPPGFSKYIAAWLPSGRGT